MSGICLSASQILINFHNRYYYFYLQRRKLGREIKHSGQGHIGSK